MPLAAGSLAPPTTSGDLVDSGSTSTALPVRDQPTLMWVDPTGVIWDLGFTDVRPDGTAYWAAPGIKGLGAPPRSLTADASPRGGSHLRFARSNSRLITLPIYTEGPDHATFLTLWRGLAESFLLTDQSTVGQIVVSRPDGTQRLIDAVYQDGWDADPDGGVRWDTVALTLLCPDPWWRDPQPTTITRSNAGVGANFLSPFPSVSSSQTLGATTVTNPGTVTAWPTWTLTGPASALTATLVSTGESFTLDISGFRGGSALTGSETVTITTDPPTVRGPTGTNWVGALSWPGAVLWGLPRGTSPVTFTVSGSGSGTSVQLAFTPRYNTA